MKTIKINYPACSKIRAKTKRLETILARYEKTKDDKEKFKLELQIDKLQLEIIRQAHKIFP